MHSALNTHTLLKLREIVWHRVSDGLEKYSFSKGGGGGDLVERHRESPFQMLSGLWLALSEEAPLSAGAADAHRGDTKPGL